VHGVFPWLLVVDVKGPPMTIDEEAALRRRMEAVWASEPQAGLASWTAASLDSGHKFAIRQRDHRALMGRLTRCVLCGAGMIVDTTALAAPEGKYCAWCGVSSG
jgi:hypothetical protein